VSLPGSSGVDEADTVLVLGGDRTRTGVSFVGDRAIERRMSWDEIDEAGCRLSARLQRSGLAGGGHRLVLVGATSPEIVVAVRAALDCRASLTVLAPLDHRRGAGAATELARQLAAVAPCVVLGDDAAWAAWDDVARVAGEGAGSAGTAVPDVGGLHAVHVDPPEQRIAPVHLDPPGRQTAPVRVGPAERRTQLAHPVPGDRPAVAVLQFTSGSTGEPKPVVVTPQNLVANIDDMAERAGLDGSSDRFLSWLPLYHDMGLTGCLLTAMVKGIDLVLADPTVFVRRPSRWLRLISETRATITCAPQFAYSLVARRQTNLGDVDLSSLRIAINGAEPVDPDGIRRFLVLTAPYGLDPGAIACSYGLAEATLAASLPHPGTGMVTERIDPGALESSGEATPGPAAGANGSIELPRLGPPLRRVDVRVVDRVGRSVGPGQVGEIQLRGPSISPGYWPLGESVAPATSDRWLATGDLGYVTPDGDGELVICGRTKDVVMVGGRNHSPVAIERAVATVPGVRSGAVAAFGVDGSGTAASGTQALVVVAETRTPIAGMAQEIRRAVHDAVGVVAREVVLVRRGAIPKTTSGKVRRAASRALFEHTAFASHRH
jgi:fatty-acyl-CoA synthase